MTVPPAGLISHAQIHLQTDEISLINGEIHAIDGLINQLYEKRAALLQGLNHAQSLTRALAPEILSLIFRHACPPLNLDPKQRANDCSYFRRCPYLPFTLGHVCFLWRQVAWSTPQLWMTMNTAALSDKRHSTIAAMLQTHLANVASLPFSLKMAIDQAPANCINQVLFQSGLAKRVHSLQLSHLPHAWAASFSQHFPNLDNLWIGSCPVFTSSDIFSLSEIPSLRRLFIRNCSVLIKPPSISLTALDLHGVPIDTCAALLVQCHNLVRFRSSDPVGPREPFQGGGDMNKSPLVCQSLEDFSWTHSGDGRAKALIHRLHLPGLERFSWDEQLFRNNFRRDFAAIMPEISDDLTKLTLKHLSSWKADMVADVLETFPSIERLHLRMCHVATVTNFIKKLAWLPNKQYLPSLRGLTIDQCYDPHDPYRKRAKFDKDICRDILNIVDDRLQEETCPSFRLEFQDVEIKWDVPVRREFRELVASGYDLEVIDDIEVDWFDPDQIDDLSDDDEDADNYETTLSDLED